MKKPLPFVALIGFCFASTVFLSNGAFAQVSIDQILAFSKTDSVRIDLKINSDKIFADINLNAKIISQDTGAILWHDTLDTCKTNPDSETLISKNIEVISPQLWTPTSPALYDLIITAEKDGQLLDKKETRFGFRTFEIIDGRFYLNGNPIFLRGNAINPPDRTIPGELHQDRKFVEDYISYFKKQNFNIIRMNRHSQIWFDVCDELGMMVFQGNYGTPKGGKGAKPPKDFRKTMDWYYQNIFEPLVNHPSIVIYILSNEQAAKEISYKHRGADEWAQFLSNVHKEIKKWDPTRAIIGNAGYGRGRSGDITDIHRYWGWYYGSFVDFLNLRDQNNFLPNKPLQPITVSECVGNYTGVDGRFNICSETKQPDSQKNWTGHAPDSEQAKRALANQAFVVKQACEITRRLRSINPRLAGIMPFTILFHNWYNIQSFADMNPKPVLTQYGISYQPVLLSWELWATQLYAGSTVKAIAHVINESDDFSDLSNAQLIYELQDKDGNAIVSQKINLGNIPYFDIKTKEVKINIPRKTKTGNYTIVGKVLEKGKLISKNSQPVFIAQRDFSNPAIKTQRKIVLYGKNQKTAKALRKMGMKFKKISALDKLSADQLLIIAADSSDQKIADSADGIKTFINNGGRVLLLEQTKQFDSSWLPVPIDFRQDTIYAYKLYPGGRPFKNGMAVNPERPDHPVFNGISRDMLYLWSDYTGWKQSNKTKTDYPEVFPVTNGFVITDKDSLANTAILANYDHGLEAVALCEIFADKGSVMVSGFGLIERAGLDPVADKMLANMIAYMGDNQKHNMHPIIDSKIKWGDYASEKGSVVGVYNGLIVNTVPIVPEGLKEKYPFRVSERGFQFAGAAGGWNSRPAVQYVAKGRRPFGPYHFSLGGRALLKDKNSKVGQGSVWITIPDGKSKMLTTVENLSDETLNLQIKINNNIITNFRIAPSQDTEVLTTDLSNNTTDLKITFTGDRRIVLLETSFE